ncbi:MAG: glycosyltransferase family 4 protein [Gemmiger sp.]|nr:glycosyltransferase family 4 protein [Gemmiger sp.]
MPTNPCHVLWLVSVTLPAAAAACGVGCAADVSGGWLAGQLAALGDTLPLTVVSLDSRVSAPRAARDPQFTSIRYLLLPAANPDFAALLAEERPALIHIWGTEYTAALALHRAAVAAGIPALVGIQGVMAACAAHLCDGVPASYRRSCPAQRAIDRVVPGALLDREQAKFDALAKGEATLLAEARYLTGRTEFDRDFAAKAAPKARYFTCNETLRPPFYTGPLWQPHPFGDAPVCLLSQGNYPLKNLHTALKALKILLARWPNATLRVAGWPPLERGPLLRPIIRWMFPYQRYCAGLVKRLGLGGHLQYIGPLDAAAMRQAYLEADVFLLPSYCENSPNSLGEAMLLGLPCVAAETGGVPSLAENGTEALFYAPAGSETALADAMAALLGAPARAAALGKAARQRAEITHAPAANAATLQNIYHTIVAEVAPHG